MTLEKRRQLITTIWMFCAFASATVSMAFENAGLLSFALALVGLVFLTIGGIQELIVYQLRKKKGS